MAEGISHSEAPKPLAKEIVTKLESQPSNPTEITPTETTTVAEKESKRRRILKGLAAAAALTGLAFWGNKEIKAGKEGIETPNATFIPLYERHDVGLAAKDIPLGMDIMFKEGMPKGYSLESPPYGYIRTKSQMPGVIGGAPKDITKFQDGVLEKLAQNNTGIANADIDPSVSIDETRKLIGIRSAIELVSAAVPGPMQK